MARLIELEAVHVSIPTPVNATESVGGRAADESPTAPSAREGVAAGPDDPKLKLMIPTTSRESVVRSPWTRATTARARTWFLVGSIVVVAILIYAATWLRVPHPDATLQPTAGESDNGIIPTLNGHVEVGDISTLQQFERYHDLDVWSVEDSLGNICLVALNGAGMGRFQFQCSPPGLDLALHMSVVAEPDDGFGDWLPPDSVISLHLRENRVDVFVHPPPPET
jgi:hypothetical protein